MFAGDVDLYNEVALGVNAPIYAYYARRIAEETAIREGRCLDVGCGGGYLGLALARITELDFVFFDESPAMLACAGKNITQSGCVSRARVLRGRVQAIPLEAVTIDLIISRGSLPFWEDVSTAFRELYRVLKPGGQVYIGGGLGDPATRREVEERRRRLHPEWEQGPPRIRRHDDQYYRDALQQAGLQEFTVNRSEEGLWIRFAKQR